MIVNGQEFVIDIPPEVLEVEYQKHPVIVSLLMQLADLDAIEVKRIEDIDLEIAEHKEAARRLSISAAQAKMRATALRKRVKTLLWDKSQKNKVFDQINQELTRLKRDVYAACYRQRIKDESVKRAKLVILPGVRRYPEAPKKEENATEAGQAERGVEDPDSHREGATDDNHGDN